MPTGYTAGLVDGTDDFKSFALGCARAFGACIHQRDDSSSDSPKLRTQTNFYEERLEKAKAELARFLVKSNEEHLQDFNEQWEKELAYRKESIEKARQIKYRLQKVRDQVVDFQPPSPDHEQYKEFMLEQIDSTIEFDGKSCYEGAKIEKPSFDEYISTSIENLKNSIQNYERDMKEEKKRVEAANKWITQLYDVLGVEYSE